LMPWRDVISDWKNLANEFDPGNCGPYLLEQFQRSLTWHLYSNAEDRNILQQDQDLYDGLLEFLMAGLLGS
jgi:hypothetical protein